MTPLSAAVIFHLVTALPAMVLGAFVLWRKKGTFLHKFLGRLWVALMLMTAVGSFGIKSSGQFSWIHILSVVTIVSIVAGLAAIRRHQRERHRRCMQGAYIGLMIAFVFTLAPSRFLGQWMRQLVA
jgi:uncharacterized membrane protein